MAAATGAGGGYSCAGLGWDEGMGTSQDSPALSLPWTLSLLISSPQPWQVVPFTVLFY